MDRFKQQNRQGNEITTLPVIPAPAKEIVSIEKAVLGAILIDRVAAMDALEKCSLQEQHFQYQANRIVFSAVNAIYQRALTDDTQAIDMLTVSQELRAMGKVSNDPLETDKVSLQYIMLLTNSVNSATNIERHIRIIQQSAIRAKVVMQAHLIISKAQNNPDLDGFDLLNEQEKFVENTTEHIASLGTSITTMYDKAIEAIDNSKPETVETFKAGLLAIDEITGGAQPGELIVIAGRPSHGKTELALTVARNHAKEGKKGAVVSLEMKPVDLAKRIVTKNENEYNNRGITGTNFKLGLSDSLANLLRDSVGLDESLKNILLVEDVRGDIQEIVRTIKLLARVYGCKYVFIDYLQLIKGSGDTSTLNIIQMELTSVAKQENIVIYELSQLNRECEKRVDKYRFPEANDLKQSGQIEQDAWQIWLCYSPSKYEEYLHKEIMIHGKTFYVDKDLYLVDIPKNRSGSIGLAELRYNKASGVISSPDNPQMGMLGGDNQPFPEPENDSFGSPMDFDFGDNN